MAIVIQLLNLRIGRDVGGSNIQNWEISLINHSGQEDITLQQQAILQKKQLRNISRSNRRGKEDNPGTARLFKKYWVKVMKRDKPVGSLHHESGAIKKYGWWKVFKLGNINTYVNSQVTGKNQKFTVSELHWTTILKRRGSYDVLLL